MQAIDWMRFEQRKFLHPVVCLHYRHLWLFHSIIRSCKFIPFPTAILPDGLSRQLLRCFAVLLDHNLLLLDVAACSFYRLFRFNLVLVLIKTVTTAH